MDVRKANACTSIRAAAGGTPTRALVRTTSASPSPIARGSYYQVTGDLAYLIDYGAEMLAEIARFWVSRATYDQERNRYSIRGVIGPDEFHSGYPDAPYDGIDNNAYTNVMAVWVIMRAFDALSLLPLPNRLDLLEKLGLHNAELAHWDDVSRRMFVPFHDGVISQFEGYGELAELDWDGTGRSTATSNA